MKALGRWLMLMGSFRLATIWIGFFDISALRLAVFSQTTSLVILVPLRLHLYHFSLYFIIRFVGPIFILLTSSIQNHTQISTEIHGRTFGIWTLLNCTLCFLCANNLDNQPLYQATFLSFVYALGHFLTEYFIYQTMTLRNLSTFAILAGTSIIWMLLQWKAHKPRTPLKTE